MLTLNTYLKWQFENKKIPSDLLKMCNEQHFSQTQNKWVFKGDKSGIKIYGDTVHIFIERKDYKGTFMPGFEKWNSHYNPTSVGLKYIDNFKRCPKKCFTIFSNFI